MHTMQFNIEEIHAVVNLLNKFGTQQTLSGLRIAWKIADKLELNAADKKAINYTDIGEGRYQWNRQKAEKWTKEVEMGNDHFSFIQDLFKKADDQKSFSINDGRGMISLAEKFEMLKSEEK